MKDQKPIETEVMPPQAVVVRENATELMKRATDVAGVCKEIVLKTACTIQGKKYIKVEGWMSLATAHGCIAGSRDVKKVEGGWTAIGEIRRISDGVLLAQAEGFVGMGEKRWGKADEYACRAMAQTRAISRACRAAFAHVVVLMDAGLSTTPFEEVPPGGFDNAPEAPPASRPAAAPQPAARPAPARPAPNGDEGNGSWRNFRVPFGKNKDRELGELSTKSLLWYIEEVKVESSYVKDGKTIAKKPETIAKDQAFRDALDAAYEELVVTGEVEDNLP